MKKIEIENYFQFIYKKTKGLSMKLKHHPLNF